MKIKITALLLSLVVVFSACGSAVSPAAVTPFESSAPAASESPVVTLSPAPESPSPEPTPEPTLPPPPDIDIHSWEFLYAGIDNGVGRYHPSVGVIENQYLDERIVEPTAAFLAAARNEGYKVWIGVGYRNFEYNLYNYEEAMVIYGNSYETAKHVVPPGCSEHSTGLAFDITDEDMYAANYYDMHDETVADTPVYKWMCDHCSEYGFIVRYPEGKDDIWKRGCYVGHFRYVGLEAAKYITENNITFDEFLALYK